MIDGQALLAKRSLNAALTIVLKLVADGSNRFDDRRVVGLLGRIIWLLNKGRAYFSAFTFIFERNLDLRSIGLNLSISDLHIQLNNFSDP